jgi:diguanylate cyclase (GGDEF)-like protein
LVLLRTASVRAFPSSLYKWTESEAVRGVIERCSTPKILFPTITVVLLGIVWGATANLIRVERANAERALSASTRELADTYEARVLRQLREIDQILKVIKYAYQRTEAPSKVLADLRMRDLLPPDLVFTLSIVNATGNLVTSTRFIPLRNISSQEHFRTLARTDQLWVSRPRRDGITGEWALDFSRRLTDSNGGFAGIVTLSVDCAYFVSVYENMKLGQFGLLGLVSADGLFSIQRAGDRVSTGDQGEAKVVDELLKGQDPIRTVHAWDGIVRMASARPLHGFPLTLVVGLSESEQLSRTQASIGRNLWFAAIATVLLLLFMAVLARISAKLAQITKRENAAKMAHAERVQHLAYHDALTGLPNRLFFSKILEQSISQARRYNRSLAVVFLDLDRFKNINDTYGHQAGDQVLLTLAKKLKLGLRESDTVARFGGDEFIALLPEFEEEKYLATVAQKLLDVVSEPFLCHGQALVLTGSIGIAIFPLHGQDEQALMRCADAAMYHAKNEGRNNCQFYSTTLQLNSLKRLKIENNLRQAIERNELELHYQPKVDLASNRITSTEALLRWNSDSGMVPPSEFIPIAEETGLVVEIGRWALKTACAQSVSWQEQGLPPVCVAVNLSARQFSEADLVDDVATILKETKLSPTLLELEITESLLMQNIDRAIRVLSSLNKMGIRLAIDDFGTGYSSLSNLKRFPLTTLKIDRAFISDIPHDRDDCVITEAIVGMGKSLSMTVVAEGVETEKQLTFLRSRGCDEFQGHYFSKAIPADSFADLLRKQIALPTELTSASRGGRRARHI